jgi:hypothetical protein
MIDRQAVNPLVEDSSADHAPAFHPPLPQLTAPASGVVAEKASRRGRLYSIRGSDSPVTGAAIRVNVAGGVGDRLSPLRRARRRIAPARKPRRRDPRAPARENPLWSRRRIANELAKIGHDVGKDAVAKYMPHPGGRPPRLPSTTWGTFVRMHLAGTMAIDFLVVPTVTFNVLYVFLALLLKRRRILHVNVTAHPYAAWAAQQIVEAVGPDAHVVRLIRDRDAISAGPSTREYETLASNSCAPRQDPPGRTATRNGGWAPFVESCSIT